jgi:hypothetical protein
MSNEEGYRKLNAAIAKLQDFDAVFMKAFVAEFATELKKSITQSISAGTSFGGVPWTPKADGSKPLSNAAKALSVTAHGTVVVAQLTGIEARYHKGSVRGNKGGDKLVRPILPTRKSLGTVAKLVKQVAAKTFQDTTK